MVVVMVVVMQGRWGATAIGGCDWRLFPLPELSRCHLVRQAYFAIRGLDNHKPNWWRIPFILCSVSTFQQRTLIGARVLMCFLCSHRIWM